MGGGRERKINFSSKLGVSSFHAVAKAFITPSRGQSYTLEFSLIGEVNVQMKLDLDLKTPPLQFLS